MRKRIVASWILWLLCISVSPLWAGGIRGKSNLSADYFRSLTRNAATDAADVIAYNPAGVMKLKNGIYTKLDFLYTNKDYRNDVTNSAFPGTSDEYDQDEPSIIPGLFTVYKQDRWAGFFAVTVPGGGGTVKFDKGNATSLGLGTQIHVGALTRVPPIPGGLPLISDMKVEANSVELGFTFGGAYKINEMFSISGGLRYVDAVQKLDATVSNASPTLPVSVTSQVDVERTATGIGFFVGVNVSPTDQLNIGFLYQSSTELDLENDVSKGQSLLVGTFLEDGAKERNDLPGLIGLGVAYQVNPSIRLEIAYTQYLESDAELESERFDDAGDSSDTAFSITYSLNPQWRFSLGYMITNIEGLDPEDISAENPELDANTIGLGAVYSPTDRFDITFGYTDVTYNSVKATFPLLADIEYKKHVTAGSIGFQYRF